MSQFGETVLAVDDEEAIRLTIKRGLESAGYQVLVASGGQEALELFSKHSIDVMLLDIRMPGVSGLDVLAKVMAEDPDFSVIMVTAIAETRVAVEAMKAGAFDYLLKPFDLDDLVLRVRRAQEHRRLVLRERESQQEMERRVREQEVRLKDQFSELIQSLSREHALALEVVSLRKPKQRKGLFSTMPAELQQPKPTVEEFAQALLRIVRSGSLERK